MHNLSSPTFHKICFNCMLHQFVLFLYKCHYYEQVTLIRGQKPVSSLNTQKSPIFFNFFRNYQPFSKKCPMCSFRSLLVIYIAIYPTDSCLNILWKKYFDWLRRCCDMDPWAEVCELCDNIFFNILSQSPAVMVEFTLSWILFTIVSQL